MGRIGPADTRPGYENFDVCCRHCRTWIRYNRASDLGTFEIIDGRDVPCLNASCRATIHLTWDTCTPAYESLFWDCNDLKQEKRYMQCMLALAQAFEMFYARYLQATIVERFVTAGADLPKLNLVSAQLYNKTRRWTAAPMRSAFLHRVIEHPGPATLADAEALVASLKRPNPKVLPSDATLRQAVSPEVGALLVALKHCDVDDRRNQVVHKHAHRPTLAEVESSLETTRSILFPLAMLLGLTGARLGIRPPAAPDTSPCASEGEESGAP